METLDIQAEKALTCLSVLWRRRMDTGLEWIGEGVFRVGDLLFKDGGPHGLKTTSEEVIIRKSRQASAGR